MGSAVRRSVASVPGGPGVASGLAATMSPAFRVAVGLLIASPSRRGTGVRALITAVSAATAARLLRDRLGRRRPGPRAEGGFPSRHAAAAAAIATTAVSGGAAIGGVLAGAAVIGGIARVAAGEHEPGDILAGAALGVLTAAALGRLLPARRSNTSPERSDSLST